MKHPVTIDRLGDLYIVRDDLVSGGSKQRVLAPIIHSLAKQGYKRFVYAGPAEGYAQLALAYAAKEVGVSATYFVPKRITPHRNTIRAQQAGCDIQQIPYGRLNVLQARAREFCRLTGSYLFPFGFDMPEYRALLTKEITIALTDIHPTEIWSVAGSGLLTHCLQAAKPDTPVHAVRIGAQVTVGRAHLYTAPETFSDDAKQPPPFPSSPNYDAKAWQFITRHAQPGALFWNVGA